MKNPDWIRRIKDIVITEKSKPVTIINDTDYLEFRSTYGKNSNETISVMIETSVIVKLILSVGKDINENFDIFINDKKYPANMQVDYYNDISSICVILDSLRPKYSDIMTYEGNSLEIHRLLLEILD